MNFRKLLVKFIILFTLLCCSNQVNGRSTEKVVTKGKDVEKSNPEYGFIHALTASFSVVLISEIGDKTFFIAAIYAMQYSRLIVFLGSMTALGTMTILSAYLGNIITIWLPRHITILCSSVLFIFFGMKMLYEAKNMENENADDELEDVRKELYNERSKEFIDNCDQENWWSRRCRPFRICSNFIQSYVNTIFIQSLTLTFLAEWGDRSQLSTIILGTRENILGVCIGGTVGHAISTGMAVIAGKMIASKITIKSVTYVGAVIFFIFGFSAFFLEYNKS